MDHLTLLKFGSAVWNVWRREHPDVAVNLDGANLNGMILTGIDFSRASLRGARMHASEADLLGADPTGATFSADDVKGALHVTPPAS